MEDMNHANMKEIGFNRRAKCAFRQPIPKPAKFVYLKTGENRFAARSAKIAGFWVLLELLSGSGSMRLRFGLI